MRNNGWVALAIAVGIIILSVAVHAAFITFVTPDGVVTEGNLFNLDEGSGITITGNDATNTITIATTASGAATFDTPDGVSITTDNLNFANGASIDITGNATTDTITVGVTGNFPTSFITAKNNTISEPWSIPGWGCETTTTALGFSQNDLWYGFIVPPQTTTYTSIGINVTSAGAGGTVGRLGLYAAELAPDGWQPGELILDAGTVDISSTGSKEVAISETLQGGTPYFTAFVHDAAAVTTTTCNQSQITVSPATARGRSTSINLRGISGSSTGEGTGAFSDPAPDMNSTSTPPFNTIVRLSE